MSSKKKGVFKKSWKPQEPTYANYLLQMSSDFQAQQKLAQAILGQPSPFEAAAAWSLDQWKAKKPDHWVFKPPKVPDIAPYTLLTWKGVVQPNYHAVLYDYGKDEIQYQPVKPLTVASMAAAYEAASLWPAEPPRKPRPSKIPWEG